MNIEKVIEQNGIIPVVKFNTIDSVLPTTEALLAGGFTCIEVTYRTAAAGDAIRIIRAAHPEAAVGAGTILTKAQADDAVKNGADFLVSPGINPEIVKYAAELNVPMIPGCCTPSEIENGLDLGLTLLKFFPAEASGGVVMLKALSAPYHMVKFMPTGGIGLHNINDYLALDCVCGCGGSFMIDETDPEKTKKLAEEAFLKTLNLHIGHIGLNHESDEDAKHTARIFSKIFNVDYDDRGGAIFTGNMFEVLKSHGRGRNGHIQIFTSSIERAEKYFSKLGLYFDENSKAYDKNGKLTLAYFREEVAGMALHLSKI